MFDYIPPEFVPYAQILLAFFLGGVLGFQREYTGKDAGLRTYMLVTMGAALFAILSKGGFDEFVVSDLSRFDPSRIASNIVTGIGFLGAGVIIFQNNKVRGLTTAAGLWIAAAIGAAVGLDQYGVAIFTALVVFVIFDILGRLHPDSWIFRKRRGEK